VGQAAAHVPHQGVGESHQPQGDAGLVHDLARQDEEGHGHEGEQVQALEVALGGHGHEVHAADLQEPQDAGDAQHVANGQADEHEHDEGDGDANH